MKSKAAFINDHARNSLELAFDPQLRDRLRETLEFPEEVILTEQMEEYKDYLAETKYLFSTWGMPALSEEEIRRNLPKLEAVFYAAGSVQPFARPYLNCGVRVFSAWKANAVPVAEYTVAQIILAGKGYFQGMRRQAAFGREAFRSYSDSLPCNYNTKIGILGAGGIGSLVLNMLKSYHMKTMVYDPFASDEKIRELGAERASLEEIFSQCQIISCHIANLPETQKMLRYEHFSRMKKNAVFINTGRGAQVVEEDLIRAMKEEPDRTALLDVTMPEPPEPDSPFWTLPNVFLTPHIAGSMNQEIARMGEYVAEEYERMTQGKECRYEVTMKMLETMA